MKLGYYDTMKGSMDKYRSAIGGSESSSSLLYVSTSGRDCFMRSTIGKELHRAGSGELAVNNFSEISHSSWFSTVGGGECLIIANMGRECLRNLTGECEFISVGNERLSDVSCSSKLSTGGGECIIGSECLLVLLPSGVGVVHRMLKD